MEEEIPRRELPSEWGGVIPSECFMEEAKKIVELAGENGITLRIMGGVATRLHCRGFEGFASRLARLGEGKQEFSDLDFMCYGKYRDKLKDFLKERFSYAKRKTTLSSAVSGRDIYFHPKLWWFADIFFDELRVANHPISFRGRLELDFPTITVTDLLLEKLQMWELFGAKDIKDVMLLLRAHDVGEGEEEAVNARYVAKLPARDWGFYYTLTCNLRRMVDLLQDSVKWAGQQELLRFLLNISEEEKADLITKASKILRYVDEEPKGFGWKMRAKIGTRQMWYNPVESEETAPAFGVWRLREVFPEEE